MESGEVTLLLGERVEIVDLAGDALLLGQGGLEDFDRVLAKAGWWGLERLESDGGVPGVEVVQQFHGVGILFCSLETEPLREAVVGTVSEVDTHAEVVVVCLQFVADLGVYSVLEGCG